MSDRGYLLDTNVVSELARRNGHAGVLAFIASIRDRRAFLSVITLGELRRGAERRRRDDPGHAGRLDLWIDHIEAAFAARILAVDLAIARIWGEISAVQPHAAIDKLIAATAIAHRLTLVTRNVRDVASTGVAVVDPWTST